LFIEKKTNKSKITPSNRYC